MIFCVTAESVAILAFIAIVVAILNWKNLREWCRNTSKKPAARSTATLPPSDDEDDEDAVEDDSEDEDLEGLSPEELAKKRKMRRDIRMLRLMGMANAQHEVESSSSVWLRAWFPCLKLKKKRTSTGTGSPRRQMSLQSPLLKKGDGDGEPHLQTTEISIDEKDSDGEPEDEDEKFRNAHGRYIALAASRVRDAIDYKYRATKYVSRKAHFVMHALCPVHVLAFAATGIAILQYWSATTNT